MAANEAEANARLAQALCDELVVEGLALTATPQETGSNTDADARIMVDGQAVFVEITGYRHDGPHLWAEADERSFAKALADASTRDPSLRGLNVFVMYQMRGDSSGQERFVVPRKSGRAAAVQEFQRLVAALRAMPTWPKYLSADVSFGAPEIEAVMNRHAEEQDGRFYWTFAESEYPVLADAWKLANISDTGRRGTVVVNSDLNCRHVSGDPTVAAKRATEKFLKLDRYRVRAKGEPVWLVIHTDSYPLSSCIDSDHIPAMCDVASEILKSTECTFDAAYWLDLGAPTGTKRLYPIDVGSPKRPAIDLRHG